METAQSRINRLVDAALPHVAFDGWSETTFKAAVNDSEIDMSEARMLAPRGALDLAIAHHRQADAAMVAQLAETDLSQLRYSERVTRALSIRLDAIADKEAVRRASALFSLPNNAAEGARMIWETADHIWTALGDTSDDLNWYTKRATLSAVWSATVLYWLGDQSENASNTRAFIERRIDNVMQIEKTKAKLRENALTKTLVGGIEGLFSRASAPRRRFDDLPGHWRKPPQDRQGGA